MTQKVFFFSAAIEYIFHGLLFLYIKENRYLQCKPIVCYQAQLTFSSIFTDKNRKAQTTKSILIVCLCVDIIVIFAFFVTVCIGSSFCIASILTLTTLFHV